MLLKTGVELEPLTDQEIYEMIGGMCQVSHKEAKANNKYMGTLMKKGIKLHQLFRC